MKQLSLLKLPVLVAFASLLSQLAVAQDNYPAHVLKGTEAELSINQVGSAISRWVYKGSNINPYDWKLTVKDMPKNNQVGPPFMGHFLCLGRWGAPSDGEMKVGIPHNSEANTLPWKYSPPTAKQAVHQFELTLPLDQYQVKREVRLNAKGTSFHVRESVTNLLNTGRIHNVVQHATIGGDFLNPETLIDCNAGDGFDQRAKPEKLDSMSFTWDDARLVDGPVDLRRVNDDRGYVTTHLIKDGASIGWITASDVKNGYLLGYLFKTVDYPWLNVWHWKKDGKPHAHGLEFGTCGLGQPYKLLLDKRVSFRGRNMFEYIDAKETQTRSYVAFFIKIPKGWGGVADLKLNGSNLTVHERGSSSRVLTTDVVPLD